MPAAPAAPGARFAYVGSYTEGPVAGGHPPAAPLGIAVFRVDPAIPRGRGASATGTAFAPVQTVPSRNPSFLALHPTLPVLYAVNEIDDFRDPTTTASADPTDAAPADPTARGADLPTDAATNDPPAGRPTGSAEAYAVDPATGRLRLLNRQPTAGAAPTHLVVDPAGRFVAVANYNGATFALLPLRPDGRLDPVSHLVTQTGAGPNPDRQEGPHPHGLALDPAGRHLAAADLGTDQIRLFRLDPAAPGAADTPAASVAPPAVSLVPTDEASAAPGAGPRHLAFHPNGRFLYAVNELIPSVTLYPYDPAAGRLGPAIQTASTVPPAVASATAPAEILVHPNGRLLFATNRRAAAAPSPLPNSIAPFAVDPATGRLTPLPHATAGIVNPRHLALDPTGTRLHASNQDADTIAHFRLDPATGALTPAGNPTPTPTPVCLVYGRAL